MNVYDIVVVYCIGVYFILIKVRISKWFFSKKKIKHVYDLCLSDGKKAHTYLSLVSTIACQYNIDLIFHLEPPTFFSKGETKVFLYYQTFCSLV